MTREELLEISSVSFSASVSERSGTSSEKSEPFSAGGVSSKDFFILEHTIFEMSIKIIEIR